MKLRHLDPVLNWTGEPLKQVVGGTPEEPKYEEVTFRALVIAALNAVPEGETPNAAVLERCYDISSRMYRNTVEVELSVEDAAFIKERAGKHLLPLFYGRLCDWLEQKPQWTPADESPVVTHDGLPSWQARDTSPEAINTPV